MLAWSPDEGYTNDNYENYPERGYIARQKSGLSMMLQLFDYNFDYLCRGAHQGFKVEPPDLYFKLLQL